MGKVPDGSTCKPCDDGGYTTDSLTCNPCYVNEVVNSAGTGCRCADDHYDAAAGEILCYGIGSSWEVSHYVGADATPTGLRRA